MDINYVRIVIMLILKNVDIILIITGTKYVFFNMLLYYLFWTHSLENIETKKIVKFLDKFHLPGIKV